MNIEFFGIANDGPIGRDRFAHNAEFDKRA